MKLGGILAGTGVALAALVLLMRKASASESMEVRSDGNAKTWTGGMVIDVDGAKGAYRADGRVPDPH